MAAVAGPFRNSPTHSDRRRSRSRADRVLRNGRQLDGVRRPPDPGRLLSLELFFIARAAARDHNRVVGSPSETREAIAQWSWIQYVGSAGHSHITFGTQFAGAIPDCDFGASFRDEAV